MFKWRVPLWRSQANLTSLAAVHVIPHDQNGMIVFSAEEPTFSTREPVGTLPPPPLIDRVLAPFQRFAQTESASGLVLLACTVIALVWTNSRWAASYTHLWEMPLTVGLGPLAARSTRDRRFLLGRPSLGLAHRRSRGVACPPWWKRTSGVALGRAWAPNSARDSSRRRRFTPGWTLPGACAASPRHVIRGMAQGRRAGCPRGATHVEAGPCTRPRKAASIDVNAPIYVSSGPILHALVTQAMAS